MSHFRFDSTYFFIFVSLVFAFFCSPCISFCRATDESDQITKLKNKIIRTKYTTKKLGPRHRRRRRHRHRRRRNKNPRIINGDWRRLSGRAHSTPKNITRTRTPYRWAAAARTTKKNKKRFVLIWFWFFRFTSVRRLLDSCDHIIRRRSKKEK